MILALYNLLWQLARPLLLRKLSRRGQAEPLYLHAVHQRFARYTDQERQQAQTHAGQWVWLHAVSLGETRAADILLQALRAVQPGMRLLLTHGTATGRQAGQKLLREGDISVQESVRQNAASLRQALGDRYTLFERFVSAFAFEEALALLSHKSG